MGFLEAYKSFWKNYINFNGRSSCSAYWYAMLGNGIILVALYICLAVSGFSLFMTGGTGATRVSGGLAIVFIIALWVYLLAILIPAISITVRRFHDSGKSGFMALLYFVPGVGSLLILIFMCFASDAANQYGESSDDI
ncbi:DUF805 domain-containing protein [Listeria monocytogenes]|nr:DUF805 domain-containing protein [Listeria monocytogenes]